jgi:hypothetical protein
MLLTSCSIDAPFQIAMVNGDHYLVTKRCKPSPIRRIEVYDTPYSSSTPGPLIMALESNQNGVVSSVDLDSPAAPFSIVEGSVDLSMDAIQVVVFDSNGDKYDQIFFSRSRTKPGWTGGGPGKEYKLSNYAPHCGPATGSP